MNPIKKVISFAFKKAPWLGAPFAKNPIFIVGSGRSGTTYLVDLLDEHPDITTLPGEANEYWHVGLYPYHEKQPKVAPIWIDPVTFTRKSLSLWPWGWKFTIKGVFGRHCIFNKSKVFVQKTVMNNFMLPEMLEMFPNAKFIYMVRNGWSVALSFQKKEVEKYANPIYRQYVGADDYKTIRLRHAVYWNDIIQKVEEDKHLHFSDKNFLEIRYEDLVKAPESTIAQIIKFMGLKMSPHPEFVRAIAEVTDKNYKARQELDAEEKSELEEAMGAALRLKGYV